MSHDQPSRDGLFQVGSKRDQHLIMRDGTRLAADIFRPFTEGEFPALLSVGAQGKAFVGLPPALQYRVRECGPIDWYVERGYAFVHVDARGCGKSEGRFEWTGPAFQADLYDAIEWIADQPWCNGHVGMIGAGFAGAAQWLAAAQQPPHLRCIAPYDALFDPYRDLVYHGGVPSRFPSAWFQDLRARRLLEYPDRRWPSRMPIADAVVKRLTGGSGGTFEEAGLRVLSRARRLMDRVRPSWLATDPIHPMLDAALDGPLYWMSGAFTRLASIKTPFYSVANWSSLGTSLRGNLLAFELIDAPKKLLVNGEVGEPSTWPLIAGPDLREQVQQLFNSVAFHEELLRWYDYWLKERPTGVLEEPPVRYWMQGAGAYRTASAWPPVEVAYRPLYLKAGPADPVYSLNDGALVLDAPTAESPPSVMTVPDPSWSGEEGLGTAVISKAGIPDRIGRILTFTSAPLEAPLEIAGPIRLVLYASSTETDADFVVRVADEPPVSDDDARVLARLDLPPQARVVSRGWLRASHRAVDEARDTPGRPWHPHAQAEPLEPGHVYAFDIEIWPTAWRFEPGHRIRLEIAPGDSSYFDRPVTHFFRIREGADSVWHDGEHPSRLLLPVLPV